MIPGAEEVLALLELRLHALSDDWDVIVVDCAPTAETLRLLALPEALGWYMQRVFPVQQRVVKALRPVLTRAAGVPMPGGSVFDAIERLHAELDEVRALLSGPDASVRIVLTPESVVLAEARRSYTTLSLYGYRVDGVVANRVFPAQDADDWRAGWVLAQDEVLAAGRAVVRGAAAVARGVPARSSRSGSRRSATLARALYDDARPGGHSAGQEPVRGGDGPRRRTDAAPAAVRQPRPGRPGPQRRRAGGDRGPVSSPPHPARRAWPGSGSPGPGWTTTGCCRCGSRTRHARLRRATAREKVT